MNASPHSLSSFLLQHWRDGLEIALLWIALFSLWKWLREVRGIRAFAGLAVAILLVLLLSEFLYLPVVDWLLAKTAGLALFALVVIFQPELRRAAVLLGNSNLFTLVRQNRETVELLSEVTFDLANQGLGALIAIERDVPLDSWAEAGVSLDSKLSTELVLTIFHEKTPLHDGGLILRSNRMLAGACIFPITQRIDLDRSLGLRHRAALGLSEETDAVIIVVSEENSVVSLCHEGIIERPFEPADFKQRLYELLTLPGHEEPAP
jgi:diadenylate cyclase